MRILVQLSHPAHYHYHRYLIEQLRRDGHEVYLLIKTKDVLENLLKEAGETYYNINEHTHRGSKIGLLWDMLVRDIRVLNFCLKYKIDLLTGSSAEVAHVGWLLCKPAICTGEDDAAIIPLFIKCTKPFLKLQLSPETTDRGSLEPVTIHYPGFQKLAYLHPKRFTPKAEVLKQYHIDPKKPYFLIRFAKLNAHHDTGVQGISTEVAQHIIDLLAPHGQIYITSERELEPQFEQYRLHISPLDIHHVMAFATIYIGDSQSMAVEAAMLGVPSLRFNDFVGAKKIGVMEELEHKYKLTYGISSHEPEALYKCVEELLAMPNLKEEWAKRREKMLGDKIDVTAFFTWFIENYPQSAQEARERKDNKDFWKKFK